MTHPIIELYAYSYLPNKLRGSNNKGGWKFLKTGRVKMEENDEGE